MSEQKISYEQAKTFLEVLGEVYGCKEFQFQTFDDCKSLKRTHLSRKIFGDLDTVFNKLSDLNNQGAGIFICVNKTDGSGERQNKVITNVRSVFADLDGVECEYPLDPSLVVQSKRGEHAYWFTTECELENFKKVQLSIASKLNSDKNVNDLCRVMRLPGFFHKKDPNNPFMVTVSKTTREKYAFNKIIEAFPSVSAPEAVKKTNKKEVKASNSEIKKYVLSQAPAVEGENGDINTYKVACALVKGFSLPVDEALTYFKSWNEKCAPMWSDEELLQKLKNAQMYGTGDSGYLIKRPSKTQWLKDFLSERTIKMDYHGKIKTGDKSISFEELMRVMKIEYDEKFGSNPKILESILEQHKVDCQKEILKKYQMELAFDIEIDDQEIQKFTTALVGNSDANFDLHVVVIKHFLWQVKRKLFAMPVEQHLCPILIGIQGSGKTEAIKALLSPLKDLTYNGELSMFKDVRELHVFTRYFVIVLDEFARADLNDMENMKRIITLSDINYRVFNTQSSTFSPNVSTFIGSTNKDLDDVIFDPTGVRRYHVIRTLSKVDWQTINDINYFKLWKSVDENRETPILNVLQKLKEQQELNRAKSSLEEWLAEENILPLENETKTVAASKCYEEYKKWMHEQFRKPMSIVKFGKELKRNLIFFRDGGGRFYKVNLNCSLLGATIKKFEDPTVDELLANAQKTDIIIPPRKK